MTTDTQQGYEGWTILEIFGHRKLGGYVRVSPPEMPGLIRVDVHTEGDTPIATQFYGPSAIFCMTPCTEETARALGRKTEVKPVARYELLPPPARDPNNDHDGAKYARSFDPGDDDDESDEL